MKNIIKEIRPYTTYNAETKNIEKYHEKQF